jgi:hypothetical protein
MTGRQAPATGIRCGAAVRGHSADPKRTRDSRMQLRAVCQLGSSVSRWRGEANKHSAVCRPVARVSTDSSRQNVAQQRPRRGGDSASLAARRSQHQVVFSVAEQRRLARVGQPAGLPPGTPAQRKVPARLALLSGRVRKLQQWAQGEETSGCGGVGKVTTGLVAPCIERQTRRAPSSGRRHTAVVVATVTPAVTRCGRRRRTWSREAGHARDGRGRPDCATGHAMCMFVRLGERSAAQRARAKSALCWMRSRATSALPCCNAS